MFYLNLVIHLAKIQIFFIISTVIAGFIHFRRVDEFAQMLNVTPKYLSKLLMDTMNRKPSTMVAFFTLKAISILKRVGDGGYYT